MTLLPIHVTLCGHRKREIGRTRSTIIISVARRSEAFVDEANTMCPRWYGILRAQCTVWERQRETVDESRSTLPAEGSRRCVADAVHVELGRANCGIAASWPRRRREIGGRVLGWARGRTPP